MNVFVLWEDRVTGTTIDRFGPHAFLVACVAALLGRERHALRQSKLIDGKTCGGNSNVLGELEKGLIWRSNAHIVSVLDTDKLHDRFAVASRRSVSEHDYVKWIETVSGHVRARAPESERARVHTCFLDDNLEQLIAIVGLGTTELTDALGKDRFARDKILQRAADDRGLIARACAEMPSWKDLVEVVAALLR